MNQTSPRNQKIQLLRGIAICAVVIIHTHPYNLFGVFLRSFVNFAVSLFFFLSGYLTKLTYEDWGAFYRKRLTRVVIPYLFWASLWSLVKPWITGSRDNFLLGILTGSCLDTYYFVIVYVQFVLLTPWISKLIRSDIRWAGWLIQPVAVVLLQYFGLESRLPVPLLFSWFGPYYLGLILGNRVQTWTRGYRRTLLLWCGALLLSIGEGLFWYGRGNYALAVTQLSLSNCLYSICCLLLACLYLNDDRRPVKTSPLSGALVLLGDCSFGIYLIHTFFITALMLASIYQTLVFPVNTLAVLAASLLFVLGGRKLLGPEYGRFFGFF